MVNSIRIHFGLRCCEDSDSAIATSHIPLLSSFLVRVILGIFFSSCCAQRCERSNGQRLVIHAAALISSELIIQIYLSSSASCRFLRQTQRISSRGAPGAYTPLCSPVSSCNPTSSLLLPISL